MSIVHSYKYPNYPINKDDYDNNLNMKRNAHVNLPVANTVSARKQLKINILLEMTRTVNSSYIFNPMTIADVIVIHQSTNENRMLT